MKKIISSLTAMVMAFSLFSGALPASAEEAASPAIENNMQVESTNSFGDLVADKITAKTAEQQANNGCNIFSAEVTGNKATISFETLKDCTLIAAIYDEAGNQMLASGSEYVEKGEKEKTVTIDIETMPQYFYFKAFLVDMVTLKPISTVYESPNYTQEMQEFFAKTVDDFDSEKVLNLDDDKSTNFAVFGEDTKIITTDGDSNKVTKADDTAQQYVFENADETMTALKVGDIFAYQYESKEMLIVKVGKIDIDGTTVTVTGEDTSLENVFEYVKIEADSDMSDATVDTSNLPEGVTCNGIEKVTETDSPKALIIDGEFIDIDTSGNGVVFSLPYDFNESVLGDEEKGTYAKVSGNANLAVTINFKLYISTSYQHCSLTADYDFTVSFVVEGQAEGSIPIGKIAYTPVVGVTVSFTPSVVARVSAKIELGGSLKGRFGFELDSETGCRSLSETPKFEPVITMEGTFFLGLSLKPELDLVGKYVAEASITAELGVEIKAAAITEPQETATRRHSCCSCIDGDFSAVINLDAKVKFLKLDKLEFGIEPENLTFKIGDFYYSQDKNEFGLGECPYADYLVNITVKDTNYNPVSGATICRPMYLSNYAETDENGNASCFLTGGSFYSLMAKKGNICGYKNLTVEGEGINLTIIMDKTLPVDPIDISFSVADKDGNVIEGAEISNDFNDETAVSDAEGKAVMKLPEGYYKFSVKADGFSPLSDSIIVDKDNCDIDIKVYKYGDFPNLGGLGGGLAGSITGGKSKGIIGNVKEISMGYAYSTAITEDGSLYMWGQNSSGKLGTGSTEDIISTPIKILDNVKSISQSDNYFDYFAAITENGSLYMWGNNRCGQLGNGESGYFYRKNYAGTMYEGFETKYNITPIKIMDNVKSVALGNSLSAAITKDGSLYTWGANDYGQLGNGTEPYKDENGKWQNKYSSTPIKIMDNVKSVSITGGRCAAIKEDGSLYTWGNNQCGQLGNGESGYDVTDGIFHTCYSVTPIKIMENVKSVCLSKNSSASAAITKDGSLYTWGDGWLLGNGTPTSYTDEDGNKRAAYSSTPIKILENVKSVNYAAFWGAGVITEDGSLYMWGMNNDGRLGNGTKNDDLTTPTKIMDNVKAVSFGYDHSAAITEDGSLYMWGYNENGCLGNGESGYYIDESGRKLSLYSSTPTKLMDNVKSISLGAYHSSAITEDGDLYMWGSNSNGQIGNGKYNSDHYFNGSKNCLIPTKINDAHSSLSTVLNTRRYSLLSDEPAEETGGEKSYTDLKPNTVYNFYCLKTRNTETPLSGENILYVNQYVSDENGNLNISYEPKEEYAEAVTLLTTSATTDISGAKVTVPDIVCNGEEQFAQPTVTLDGITLTEGIDYDVEKDFSTSVPGEFELIISGAGDYSGKVTASYKAACAHNYENGVCTICGEAGFILGDASGDGVFNIRDAAWICIRRAKGEVLTVENNPAADYNGDNKVDVRDAAAIAIHFAKITE